jgi:hypothetical protein
MFPVTSLQKRCAHLKSDWLACFQGAVTTTTPGRNYKTLYYRWSSGDPGTRSTMQVCACWNFKGNRPVFGPVSYDLDKKDLSKGRATQG